MALGDEVLTSVLIVVVLLFYCFIVLTPFVLLYTDALQFRFLGSFSVVEDINIYMYPLQ